MPVQKKGDAFDRAHPGRPDLGHLVLRQLRGDPCAFALLRHAEEDREEVRVPPERRSRVKDVAAEESAGGIERRPADVRVARLTFRFTYICSEQMYAPHAEVPFVDQGDERHAGLVLVSPLRIRIHVFEKLLGKRRPVHIGGRPPSPVCQLRSSKNILVLYHNRPVLSLGQQLGLGLTPRGTGILPVGDMFMNVAPPTLRRARCPSPQC